MQFIFDSVDEIKGFVKLLKGTRAGKGDDEAETETKVPTPLVPPTGGTTGQGFPSGATGFAPPAGGATAAAGGFPAAGAQPSPEVLAVVNRIITRFEGGVQSGATKLEDGVTWFRQQCGPEAAAADWNALKTVIMPRMSLPALAQIAQFMGA